MGIERSVEEDPEPKGFWVGVDLCIGAIRSLSEREKEREKETEHNHNPKTGMKEYVCMKYPWTCDVLKINCIMGWNLIQIYQHTIFNNQAQIYMQETLL